MTRAKPISALICCAIAVSLAGAGCSRLSARTAPEPPPLDMPVPPPRIVETVNAGLPQPGTLVDAPPSGDPSSRRPPARVEAPKPGPAKPDPTPAPAEVTPQGPKPPQPATTLQTTPPEREPQVEQQILIKLAQASNNLSRVDYRRLNDDAKEQYDQAKRFITLAEDSLRDKNLVYASRLAENALALATQLAGR